MSKKSTIILGIDPGTIRIGYGLIRKEGEDLKYVQSGLINIHRDKKENQLLELEKNFLKLLYKTRPNLAGIEKLYFVKNKKTALDVAQARGVIIAALAKSKTPFIEVAPTQVKLAATGNGRASKEAVAKMICLNLGLDRTNKKIDDVTDALAVAIAVSSKTLTI